MAFTYTRQPTIFGNKRAYTGTHTNTAGSTGGVIVTGLTRIEYFNSNNNDQAATTNQVVISGGSVTLTTVADSDGQWVAIGV